MACDVTIAKQCLEITKTLISMGAKFKFSLKMDNLSYFVSSTVPANQVARTVTNSRKKKYKSPSTIRRNQRRMNEFVKKKSDQGSVSLGVPVDSPTLIPVLNPVLNSASREVPDNRTVDSDNQSATFLHQSPITNIPQLDGVTRNSDSGTNMEALIEEDYAFEQAMLDEPDSYG